MNAVLFYFCQKRTGGWAERNRVTVSELSVHETQGAFVKKWSLDSVQPSSLLPDTVWLSDQNGSNSYVAMYKAFYEIAYFLCLTFFNITPSHGE